MSHQSDVVPALLLVSTGSTEAQLLASPQLDGHGCGLSVVLCSHALGGCYRSSVDLQLGCVTCHAWRVSALDHLLYLLVGLIQ